MFLKVLVVALFAACVYAEIDEAVIRDAMKTRIREACKSIDAEDKTEDVQGSVTTFIQCLKTEIDPTTVAKEIQDAKPNGALDEVFKKYCAKAPQVKNCFKNLLTGISPCVDTNLRPKLDEGNNATELLIDFVCYKEGDRIALFIAEGGPECFTEKQSQLQECGQKIKDSVGSVEDAKKLTATDRCAKFDELKTCLVTALEGCSTPTPANMAESLLNYIRKNLCK